jgi:pyrimidine oxygenase
MDVGIFIPIGNNGWIASSTSQQYKPSFDLNRTIVEKAGRYRLDFALSMIKLRKWHGPVRPLHPASMKNRAHIPQAAA